jgi:hypothetical protein
MDTDVAESDLADQVLRRLERIERLGGALVTRESRTGALLSELRSLVGEAEAWARAEGDRRARDAVEKLRGEAEGMR